MESALPLLEYNELPPSSKERAEESVLLNFFSKYDWLFQFKRPDAIYFDKNVDAAWSEFEKYCIDNQCYENRGLQFGAIDFTKTKKTFRHFIDTFAKDVFDKELKSWRYTKEGIRSEHYNF